MRFVFSLVIIQLILPISAFSNSFAGGSTFIYKYENVLGTSFQLKVLAINERVADKAENTALNEIERLRSILSTYDPNSEVSRWQKTIGIEVPVSAELFEVLRLFESWQTKTNGALNASVGSAATLWKTAEKNQKNPVNTDIMKAVYSMNQPHWNLNAKKQTAIHLTHEPLILNSFVKSYILSKVTEKLKRLTGISGVVLDIGGDICISGEEPEMISVSHPLLNAENDHPLSTLKLKNRTIATSGNYRRGYNILGKHYSHIIDPRTGFPVNHISGATVIAPKATDAGALATAFNVLDINESIALAKSFDSIDFELVTSDGKIIQSNGWKALIPVGHIDYSGFTPFQPKFSVTFQLASFETRYRRPFVAVWIENKKKDPVKTLALWYNKPRWLPDLKRWYSKSQKTLQDPASISLISSATRTAGNYSLSWDGLDENGKPVPSGTYTLYIEAAREHGTYQLIKQEFQWNGKAFHFDLQGGVEISSASLDIIK